MEYVAKIGNRFVCSDGALFTCYHCPGHARYWIGWWPYCSAGHDQRVCPFSFMDQFDLWFAWQVAMNL